MIAVIFNARARVDDMTDYLSWLYTALIAIPALTILFATRKAALLQRDRLTSNLAELSAFFTIPVFYFAVAVASALCGLLATDFSTGFIAGGALSLLAGEAWLIAKLRPLLAL